MRGGRILNIGVDKEIYDAFYVFVVLILELFKLELVFL